MIEMINIGFSSVIPKHRIIGIDETGSSPIKRMIKQAKEEGRVIDVTHGRKTKSVIWLDNGSVYLSSVSTSTLTSRMQEDLNTKQSAQK